MDGLVPTEVIENKILLIRSQKVMLDADLAELYGIYYQRFKNLPSTPVRK
jgi:hypothetical protein